MIALPRFMIAAAHKSSGKTVISTGLVAALRAAGDQVSTFKKGPDYIDPTWLDSASGAACYNRDFNVMGRDDIAGFFASRAAGLSLIEANKGLFDGVRTDGTDSNAALAKLLGLPVILVIDTLGMSRGIAPLLQGYQGFDRDVTIAGFGDVIAGSVDLDVVRAIARAATGARLYKVFRARQPSLGPAGHAGAGP